MSLVGVYRDARCDEETLRLRRGLALRAMAATGLGQRAIAESLGVSQPAVSQQLKFATDPGNVHPEVLLEAATPVLKALADTYGYGGLATFGSVARRQARDDSDIDLLVQAPAGTSTFAFIRFEQLIEGVLGRDIDLVSYGGLKAGLDDDIRREVVLL